MLHVVLDPASGEDRVHHVYAGGMHADQDLAFSGLGDGKLANGAGRSEAVDGKGAHQSVGLESGCS